MLVILWQPQSYAIRIIEANLQAILIRKCNNRQLESLPHSPMSQEPLELATIIGETAGSTSPLNALYHQTLKIVFSFYQVWDKIPQQDGTHQVSLITTASLHPDLVPCHNICLPIGHDWPRTKNLA